MIQVQQSITFSFTGDGTSPAFSYDLVQPPFSNPSFTGEEFAIGSPVSFTAAIEQQMISGVPVNWFANFQYPVGRVIEYMDNNGISYAYQCTVAGLSGSTQPNFPTVASQTVQEPSGLLWTCLGLNTIVPIYTSYTATVGLSGTVFTLTFNSPLPGPSQPVSDAYGNIFSFPFWNVTLTFNYNSYS